MGINDKMIQDQIWVRPHVASDVNVETRTHGQHFLALGAPNAKERIEMAYRSLGRQYDWDMEKFRNSPKPADKGNRRRFLRNASRFVKNPFGYAYWKTYRFGERMPFILTLMVLSFVADFFYQRRIANNQKRIDNFMYYEGAEPFASDFVDTMARPSKLAIPNTAIFRAIYSYPMTHEFVLNPVYEQAFRKYFDMNPHSTKNIRRV